MKALDLMIVMGGPKKTDKSEYAKGDKGGAAEMLAMHPLAEMSNDDLQELYSAVEAEMSSRGSEEDMDDEDMTEEA